MSEASLDPSQRGPDWTHISPVAGSLFHEKRHTAAAARALMSRGLDRLRRVARAEGIEFPDELHGGDDEEEELSPELLAATREEAE